MTLRMKRFLYIFTLRQGVILIGVVQVALTFFVLILHFVGMSHANEMLGILRKDMEDEAERRGFYEILNDEVPTYLEGRAINTNNQRRFENGQELASDTVVVLRTSITLIAIHLLTCFSLLYGTVQRRYQFFVPWIIMNCMNLIAMISLMIVITHTHPCLVFQFGGYRVYVFLCIILVVAYAYVIISVISFAMCHAYGCVRERRRPDERGERMLLLDHAAHSNLVTATQLNKLSHGTAQFV